MVELFKKLLAWLPKDSNGLELEEYGIKWGYLADDAGHEALMIFVGGLAITITIEEE